MVGTDLILYSRSPLLVNVVGGGDNKFTSCSKEAVASSEQINEEEYTPSLRNQHNQWMVCLRGAVLSSLTSLLFYATKRITQNSRDDAGL